MTETFQVPAEVLANVQQRWPDNANSWASQVVTEFLALCDKYQATPHSVLPARYGFVVAVDSPNGPLVLRGSPDPHGPDQAAVAAALADLGISPIVHQTWTTDHGTWTVLDRIRPGTPLYDADLATISLEALFEPLAAMKEQPPPHPSMPSLIDWLRSRLENNQLSDLRPGTTVAPNAERQAALESLADLARSHIPGLCHGDASLGNILANGTDRWIFIDPRGMTGEYAYDVAVLTIRVARLRKSADLVPHIAQFADVDPERVRPGSQLPTLHECDSREAESPPSFPDLLYIIKAARTGPLTPPTRAPWPPPARRAAATIPTPVGWRELRTTTGRGNERKWGWFE